MPTSARPATSRAARTCTCRTCSRTSRPGTSTSTIESASTRRSGRASRCRATTLSVAQPPEESATAAELAADFDTHRRIGHSASIQPTSRLAEDIVGRDGVRYPRGTAVPQRADFNTIDNPFFWSSSPVRDGMVESPAAGLHFVVFNPTGDDFRRNRLAMDGVLPDGTRLPFEPGSRGRGFNAILATTHRQNFLVPPRRHRSFPLSELTA